VSRDGADKFSIFIARLIASVDREFLTPSESPSDFTLLLAPSQLGVVRVACDDSHDRAEFPPFSEA
jgi:hypothetical protein